MAFLSRRGALFGLIGLAGTASVTKLAEAFTAVTADEPGSAPSAIPPLFGVRERQLGRPEDLFPRRPAATAAAWDRRAAEWRNTIDSLVPFGVKGQIAGVHAYLVKAHDASPFARLAKSETWAAPVRFFDSGTGSEDHALARYQAFRHLGFHPGRLRVAWVEDVEAEVHYAVLVVVLGNQSLVLSPRLEQVTTDRMLPHLRPYCSVNEDGLWLHWNPHEAGGIMTALDRLGRGRRKGRSGIETVSASL